MVDDLGIVVLAYGGGGEHHGLFDSLAEQGLDLGSTVLVHNPATSGEPPVAVPTGVEMIRSERNLGYAGGMNLGIARMMERGAGWILLLTHDARLRPGALRALGGAARDSDFGVLGPALLLIGTETPFSFGGIVKPDGTTKHLRESPPPDVGPVLPCDWVDGGTIMVAREVIEAVGPFDASFWGYFEEAELCLRARRAGFGVGVVRAALADQEPGATKRLGAWAYLNARNGIEFARRAKGRRGVRVMVGRVLRLVSLNLLRAVLRLLRLRRGDPREPWLLAIGTARGAIDWRRGRWGPPPANLPGMGDVGNA